MKRCFFLIVSVFVISCDRDKSVNNSNPYLQNVSFAKEINTSFPAYSDLQFPGNPVLITDAGAGIKGIVVIKVGTESYKAYEASCPNHYPSACSLMEIDGIEVKCPCENYKYNLYSGLGNAQYPLKEYRTEASGSIIRVYN